MASRFPAPWRIVEILSGFAVEDACGQQLGVFYGRADPNIAGHTGFLTLDEARQMAIDCRNCSMAVGQSDGVPHPGDPRDAWSSLDYKHGSLFGSRAEPI